MYGRRLKIVRGNLGMTQQDFAKSLGLSQTTYSGYERESSEPPIDILKKICSLYNVDIAWLLGVEGDYRELLANQYDDFADLVSMGFSPDEASRMERAQFERYGDMVMRLGYDDRKRVVDFVQQIQSEKENN